MNELNVAIKFTNIYTIPFKSPLIKTSSSNTITHKLNVHYSTSGLSANEERRANKWHAMHIYVDTRTHTYHRILL